MRKNDRHLDGVRDTQRTERDDLCLADIQEIEPSLRINTPVHDRVEVLVRYLPG